MEMKNIKRALSMLDARERYYHEDWENNDSLFSFFQYQAYNIAAAILQAALEDDMEALDQYDYFDRREDEE